jgi:hypothetical protein
VAAIHRAFSLATASTFEFGILAAAVAAIVVVFLPAESRLAAQDAGVLARSAMADAGE